MQIFFYKIPLHQILANSQKLFHDVKVLLVFIHPCRIHTISIRMTIQEITNIPVIQFTISNNLRLVEFMSVLVEHP